MTKVLTDPQNYADIADAIREQLDGSTTYLPSEMADAIASIEGGGILHGTTAPTSDIGADGQLYLCTHPLSDDVDYVSYLQSSGTQYIDTGITATQDIDVSISAVYIGNYTIFGVRTGEWTSSTNVLYITATAGTRGCGVMKSKSAVSGESYVYTSSTTDLLLETKSVKTGTNNQFLNVINGGESCVLTKNQGDFESNGTMIAFGTRRGGTATPSSARIKRITIYDGIEPIADYIPCIDGNNVACMWDSVAQECVYNDGTGDFTAGSSASPSELGSTLYLKDDGAWTAIASGIEAAIA